MAIDRAGKLYWKVKKALGVLGLVLLEDSRADITLAPTITTGTGAPTTTEPKGSIWLRRNAPDADNAVYVSNGAGSWNALEAGGSSLTIADTFSITWGNGTDFVITADGTDAVVSGGGDLVFADAYILAIGTGKDTTFASDGTDTIVDGAGDLVLSDAYVLAVGAGKDVTVQSDGTDVAIGGTGNLLSAVDYFVADTYTIGWGTAGADIIMTADGAGMTVSGTGNVDIPDDIFRLQRDDALTAFADFELAAITAGQTRTITIPDEDVDLGNLNSGNVAVIADSNTSGAPTVLHRFDIADGAGNTDIVMDDQVIVLDAWLVKTDGAGGAGDTITVASAAGAITDAMDLNTLNANAMVRATTLDFAQATIAAAGTLRVTAATGAGDNACEVFVLCCRV
jgi:hypothetical protein